MGSIGFHIVCEMIATGNPGSGGLSGGSNKEIDAMTLTAEGACYSSSEFQSISFSPLTIFNLPQNSFIT